MTLEGMFTGRDRKMPVSTLEKGGKDNTIPVSWNTLNYIKYVYMFIISKHGYNNKYMSIIIIIIK